MTVLILLGFNDFPDIQINEVGITEPDGQGNNIYADVIMFNPAPVTVMLVCPSPPPKQGEILIVYRVK